MQIVELCHGKSQDKRDLYAFIRMNKKSHARYKRELASGIPMDLNSFGTILHTGWGKEPPPEIAARILQDNTNTIDLLDAIAEDQRAITAIIRNENTQGEENEREERNST